MNFESTHSTMRNIYPQYTLRKVPHPTHSAVGAEATKRRLRQELLAVHLQQTTVAAALAAAESRFRVGERQRQVCVLLEHETAQL